MLEKPHQLVARFAHINWALADQAVVSGANFLVGILLARYMGLEDFGRFTLIWFVVLLVCSIQHAAVNCPMMSLGPKQLAFEKPRYFGTVIIHQFVFSALAFVLMLGGLFVCGLAFPEWRVGDFAVPLAIATFTCSLQEFVRRYFFTRGRVGVAFTIDAIRYIGQLAMLVALFVSIPDGMDLNRVLWVLALTAGFASIAGMVNVGPVEFNTSSLRKFSPMHWHFAKWLIASSIMQWGTGNLFIVVAGGLLGTSAVGALKASQNLMGVMHILFMGLENIAPVQAARIYHEKGWDELVSYLVRITLGGGIVTAAVAMAMAVAPEFWLGAVYGTQYAGYGFLLQWYAIIYLLIFLSVPLRSGLRACQRTQSIFFSYCWMMLFSVSAVYPAITRLGLNGVMLGILIVNTILVVILGADLLKIRPVEKMERAHHLD